MTLLGAALWEPDESVFFVIITLRPPIIVGRQSSIRSSPLKKHNIRAVQSIGGANVRCSVPCVSSEGGRERGAWCLKKNQNAPGPSEHPPVRGGKDVKTLLVVNHGV